MKKQITLNKLILLLHCTCLMNCLHWGPIGPNYNYQEVGNFSNTYIVFKLPSLENGLKNGDDFFSSATDKKTYFVSVFIDNEELLPSACVNPEYGYWRNFYKDFNSLPQIIRNEPRFNFLPDCEYFLPIPKGKNRFKVKVYNRNKAPVGGGEISRSIDVPANFSIRINLKDPRRNKIEGTENRFALDAGISLDLEPSVGHESFPICR
ncbi:MULTISPECIES: hypothetical protein [Leptospira]|uniref:hypothetical protein n=1 Tax=Leptospira TaxID=171 RepID=UPI0002C006B4|nr:MULTISPECIES: hypothetical protein [unclassified Leptospira]EMK01222.1 hypothetical protein LEP1GSC192_1197 [Leptospira sp. B5-022]MCR1795687.1 hypothetical protein [Leptospira sp. id769339]